MRSAVAVCLVTLGWLGGLGGASLMGACGPTLQDKPADAGVQADAPALDAPALDAAIDAPPDGAPDAAPDALPLDAPPLDAPPLDAPPLDAPPPDAPPPDAPFAACNPLAQTGCLATEKCAWFEDRAGGARSACVPNGTQPLNATCTISTAGYSNCMRGSECVDNSCRAICATATGGQPMCAAQTTCQRYLELFDEPGQLGGVCDPQCDPLTQRRLTDNAEACNSTVPASPSRGCYTGDTVAFSCANLATGAITHTDRTPVLGNATTIFINGCAPGFVPLLVESTGATQVICSGTCAPKKTDMTLATNALGDPSALGKLPTQAAPAPGNATCAIGKKGSEAAEDCRYLWWFNVDSMGAQIASPYNDTLGLCIGYTHYNYDHDSSTTTPNRTFPACAALPPRGGAPSTDGTADQWGCYSSVDAQARAASTPHRATQLRLVTGGTLYRHALQ